MHSGKTGNFWGLLPFFSFFHFQIEQVQFLPLNPKTTEQLVAIATVDTLSLLTPGQETLLEVDHVVGGKLSCLDCSADLLAVGAGSYGYGILGNKVNTFCEAEVAKISFMISNPMCW